MKLNFKTKFTGEEPNEYNFTRIKLNWDGLKYSPFATYGNAISLVGTMLMVGGLSKLFKLSDPLVGFLGTFCSSIARIVYVCVFSQMLHFKSVLIENRRLLQRQQCCTLREPSTCLLAFER